MSRFNAAASARPGAGVSRPELERLEAQRRPPAPLRALTPDGAAPVNAALDRQREARIREIEARLDQAAGVAVNAHALGRMRGVARDGFDRNR